MEGLPSHSHKPDTDMWSPFLALRLKIQQIASVPVAAPRLLHGDPDWPTQRRTRNRLEVRADRTAAIQHTVLIGDGIESHDVAFAPDAFLDWLDPDPTQKHIGQSLILCGALRPKFRAVRCVVAVQLPCIQESVRHHLKQRTLSRQLRNRITISRTKSILHQ